MHVSGRISHAAASIAMGFEDRCLFDPPSPNDKHRYETCDRTFARQAALTTHVGWHRRQEKRKAGAYDVDDEHRQVSATIECRDALIRDVTLGVAQEMSLTDENGKIVSVSVYKCEHPVRDELPPKSLHSMPERRLPPQGCDKIFTKREGLHTHWVRPAPHRVPSDLRCPA